MTYDEALDFLNSTHRFGSRLGLERIRIFMERLGNPQDKLKFVHIAGTNGKGSTSAFISSILTSSGYRTGCFISPYIQRFTERISVSGVEISKEDVVRHTMAIRDEIQAMQSEGCEHPTAFEIYTAMCFLHFAEQSCDIVVLETGLGGALDATNIISNKEVAVITNIGYDHMEQLGDTLEKIAGQKAGIITCQTEVVLYPMEQESVLDVFRKRAQKYESRVHEVSAGDICITGSFLDPSFDFCELRELRINLLGEHQYKNAATSVSAVLALRSKGWNVSDEAIRMGLYNAKWPGRMEIIRKKKDLSPMVIVDGAHNLQGVEAMVHGLKSMGAGDGVTFLVGVMVDKDYENMIKTVAPLAKRFITVTPDVSGRALPSEELRSVTQAYAESIAFDDVRQALDYAVSNEELVCCFGSLYLIGEVKNVIA